jgi:hypothetical protein
LWIWYVFGGLFECGEFLLLVVVYVRGELVVDVIVEVWEWL